MDKNKKMDINKALVLKCKENNRKAQFEIYKLYSKSMYNTSLRILNDTAEAEDAMQEGFLKAFQSINEFRFESTFGTWLKRIVVNVSLDYLRKKKAVFTEITNDQYLITDDDYYDEPISAELTVKKIKDIVHDMPDGYRAIFSMHMFEGFDYDEISEITGLTVSAVRSQFCRARRKVIEHVKQKIKLY